MTARIVTVGGSEIAAVVGLDPYCSPVMLAARKLGMVPDVHESEAMTWGKRLEPLIADALEQDGYGIVPAPADGYRDPERKWCVGHPDRFVTGAWQGSRAEPGPRAVLEIKTMNQWAHAHNGTVAPVRYQCQGQWYMHLTGLDRVVFAGLVGGQSLHVAEFERDDDAIAILLDHAEAFVKLVRRGQLPETIGSESERGDLLQLFPDAAQGQVVRLDREHWHALRELRARREQLARVKEQAEALENRIKLFMGHAERAISPHDDEVVRWANVQSRRVDTTALKAAHPEIAEEFTTVTTTRRFTVA